MPLLNLLCIPTIWSVVTNFRCCRRAIKVESSEWKIVPAFYRIRCCLIEAHAWTEESTRHDCIFFSIFTEAIYETEQPSLKSRAAVLLFLRQPSYARICSDSITLFHSPSSVELVSIFNIKSKILFAYLNCIGRWSHSSVTRNLYLLLSMWKCLHDTLSRVFGNSWKDRMTQFNFQEHWTGLRGSREWECRCHCCLKA